MYTCSTYYSLFACTYMYMYMYLYILYSKHAYPSSTAHEHTRMQVFIGIVTPCLHTNNNGGQTGKGLGKGWAGQHKQWSYNVRVLSVYTYMHTELGISGKTCVIHEQSHIAHYLVGLTEWTYTTSNLYIMYMSNKGSKHIRQ